MCEGNAVWDALIISVLTISSFSSFPNIHPFHMFDPHIPIESFSLYIRKAWSLSD